MSHSLRAKLRSLRYKGIIEDKDYKRLCHALDLEKAEQELTDEWQNGYDRAWEEAEVFYEKEEPTIPCDLCGFNMDEVCEYLSVCPAIGKAVSK